MRFFVVVAQNKTKHPTVFPYQLAERHIQTWSNGGDTVLNLFIGSETTGLVALRNNRRFVGIDIVPEYLEISKNRLKDVGF